MSSCSSILYIWGLLSCFHLNKESSVLTIKYVLNFILVFKLYKPGLQIKHPQPILESKGMCAIVQKKKQKKGKKGQYTWKFEYLKNISKM